jgi:Ras-related protein Rab-1A
MSNITKIALNSFMTEMNQNDYDYLVKLLVIGDSGVGKSASIRQFAEGKFTDDYVATIGVDFAIKTIEHNGKTVKLQIWDTAGQERFRTITQSYYRGAHGVIVMYDCTDEESLANVKEWIQDIRRYACEDVVIMLVSNKCDLENKRIISYDDGTKVAEKYGIKFCEISAKKGLNVIKMFSALTDSVLEQFVQKKLKEDKDKKPIDLTKPTAPVDGNGGCCS